MPPDSVTAPCRMLGLRTIKLCHSAAPPRNHPAAPERRVGASPCYSARLRCTSNFLQAASLFYQLHHPTARVGAVQVSTVCCPCAPWTRSRAPSNALPSCTYGTLTTCRLLRAERNCTPSISAARAAAVLRWGVGGLDGCGEAEEVAGLGREMLA